DSAMARCVSFFTRLSWEECEACRGSSDRKAGLRLVNAPNISMHRHILFMGPTPGWVSHSRCGVLWCRGLEPRRCPNEYRPNGPVPASHHFDVMSADHTICLTNAAYE